MSIDEKTFKLSERLVKKNQKIIKKKNLQIDNIYDKKLKNR